MMNARFMKIGDSQYIINIGKIAYVNTDEHVFSFEVGPKVGIYFSTVDSEGEPLQLILTGKNAEKFLSMIYHYQIEEW